MFAREAASAKDHIAQALGQRTSSDIRLEAIEDVARKLGTRVAALEEHGLSRPLQPDTHSSNLIRDFAANTAFETRLAALEAHGPARPGPIDLRPERTDLSEALEARFCALEASWRFLESAMPIYCASPEPAGDVATSADIADARSGFERGVRMLEDEILVLQGELALLQTQTRLQGVSASIFSICAVDMDKRSRKKSLEVLRSREAEVKDLVDEARDVKDKGSTYELLAMLGKCAKVPASIASRSDNTSRSDHSSLSEPAPEDRPSPSMLSMVMMPL